MIITKCSNICNQKKSVTKEKCVNFVINTLGKPVCFGNRFNAKVHDECTCGGDRSKCNYNTLIEAK